LTKTGALLFVTHNKNTRHHEISETHGLLSFPFTYLNSFPQRFRIILE